MTDERLYRADHVIPEPTAGGSVGSLYLVPFDTLATAEAGGAEVGGDERQARHPRRQRAAELKAERRAERGRGPGPHRPAAPRGNGAGGAVGAGPPLAEPR